MIVRNVRQGAGRRGNRAFGDFGQAASPTDSTEAILSAYEGKRLSEVPPAMRDSLFRYAAQFDRGFSQDGLIGTVLVPWPLDRLGPPAHRNITVRRTAAERAKDLPGFRAPAWDVNVHGTETLLRFNVYAQKDWGILGTGITAKQLLGGVLAVGGAALAATGVATVIGTGAAKAGVSMVGKRAQPGFQPLSPTPMEQQAMMEQQAAQIRAGGLPGGIIGPAAGAAAGFFVAGPLGAAAGGAAGYFLTRPKPRVDYI